MSEQAPIRFVPVSLSDEQVEALRKAWLRMCEGPGSALVVLDSPLTFEPLEPEVDGK